MERMTRVHLENYESSLPSFPPIARPTLQWFMFELGTLMDERDACARRLAAATEFIERLAADPWVDVPPGTVYHVCRYCGGQWWDYDLAKDDFSPDSKHDVDCPNVAARAFLAEAAAPHGPGAARGA